MKGTALRTAFVIAWLAAPAPADALSAEALETRSRLSRIEETIEEHLEATGVRPGTPQELAVVLRLRGAGVPLRKGVPVDAWQRPLVYRVEGDGDSEAHHLYSAGSNGRDEAGHGDDLAAGAKGEHANLRRAQSLLPVALLVSLAPLAWAALRWARRPLG